MPADANAWALCAVHGDGGIPAQPGAKATFNLLVARELRLVLRCNGVDVVGGGNHRNTELKLFRPFQETHHDVARALMAVGRHQPVQ